MGARVLAASAAFAAALARDGACPHSSLYRARPRWLRRHPAAPPSLAHASSSHGARRTPACSPTLLALWHLRTPVCLLCPGLRTHSSDIGRKPRARRVRPTPPRVRGDRGQRHGRKPRACPLPAHAMDPLPTFHVVISFVSSLLSSERRKLSSAWRGIPRSPRDRQASPRTRRRSEPPNQTEARNQARQDGPRQRTESEKERGRGPAERA